MQVAPASPKRPDALVAWLVGCGIVALVAGLSLQAMGVILRNGPVALAILLSATGLGLWIVRGLGLHHAEPRWQLLAAAGLGLGAVSLLVLGLGVLGLLDRHVWIGILFACAGAGAVRIKSLRRARRTEEAPADTLRAVWLWLLVIGFAACALLAATMPPGILWPAEGHGYDVLEYHLGAPRDYFDAGRVSYLPHNIYSNFPLNVEMLYLLSMVLHGDPVAAAPTAKLLNAMLAMLAVAAVWLAGREAGRPAGLAAGILAASCPFLVYLSGVAYVENGLVFYAALALAAARRVDRGPSGRWAFAAGLFSGLACGCKYTAVPAVVVPLAIAVALRPASGRPGRSRRLLLFCAGAVVTFAPWLVKNIAATGNPVFPLAYDIFGARDGVWTDEAAARWHEGHLPAPDDRTVPRRLRRLWTEVIGSPLFGPVIGLALFAGLSTAGSFFRRRRAGSKAGRDAADTPSGTVRGLPGSLPCWLMLLIGGLAWLTMTHLVDRFAIVLIIPAAVLVGQCWSRLASTSWRALGTVALIAVSGWNLKTAWGLLADPSVSGLPNNLSYLDLNAFGRTDILTGTEHIRRINALLDRGGKVLLVGEARHFYLGSGADYCVVFNRNPFAEAAASRSPAELLDWLRARGYTHVYVDWREMNRLRQSRYGFWPSLTRDLFMKLVPAGLKPVESFSVADQRPPYATLFAIPATHRRVRAAGPGT
ncbi:MAG: glycosyltransferase family 39 protein [Phycisphaerae bacterium]